MEFSEVISAIFQYGGTVIMATKMLEDNTKMLQTLAESNQNIAKSLDIITNNLVSIDRKVDRNYEEIVKHEKITK